MKQVLTTIGFILIGVVGTHASRSVSFSNSSTNEIWVTRVLCDGKNSSILACGVLGPGNGAKVLVDYFPKIPAEFAIQYRSGTEERVDKIAGARVSELLKAAARSQDITLHFIFSRSGHFVAKIEGSGKESSPYEKNLWPDEQDPNFHRYKDLLRAAYDGNAERVGKALEDGVPFAWPDNPLGLTPLEYTVRWNHAAAFEVLIKRVPEDYPVYAYAKCIKLAVHENLIAILRELLSHSFADRVFGERLQDIFYEACYSGRPEALELLLKRYPVGIDYKVGDYGHTLLFAAVQGRNPAVVEWLMEHGADRNATLRNGSKPIDWARDEKIRQLLMRRAGDVPTAK